MSFSINQRWNDITQSTKRKVDFCCLFHAVSSCPSFSSPLRTCQVHQIQLWSLIFLVSFFIALLGVDVNGKNAMRSWRLGVHICCSCSSVFKTHFHVLLHFWNVINLYLCQILDKDTLFRTFLQLHPSFDIFSQKVVDLLIVDFDETATNEMGFRCVIFSDCYDLAERSRNDSPRLLTITAHHGVSFTTTCLPIGKYSAIVSIKHVFY